MKFDQPNTPAIPKLFASLTGRIVGKKRLPPPTNGQGVLLVGSESFREACALTEDGVHHIVPEYNTPDLWLEMAELDSRWQLPDFRSYAPATLAEIAAMYRSDGLGQTVDSGMTGGARRIMRVISEAAALRASDIKIYVRSSHADLRLKLGHAEHSHGSQWQVWEAVEAIAWLYDRRDFGDGASAQQLGRHQGFTIGAERRVPLPRSVAALRGQRGFHGDGRDFMVLRLIYREESGAAGRIEDLGFSEDVLKQLAVERTSDSGLAIIGGSTGDGKSTTLVRQLERLYEERDGQVSIVTIEDPVEYPASGEGILQIPVPASSTPAQRKAAFSETLRCFVRINPDVGMVSEIRTAEDAREILQFVISGHKIFTTVHSFSANAVLFRLISLGVDPKELSEPGVVNLVMRQRLVPVLCHGCARPAEGAERDLIAKWTGRAFGRPMVRSREGCSDCLDGRTSDSARAAWGGLSRKQAVAEYIRLDDRYRSFVEARDPRGAYAYWLTSASDGGMGGRTVDDRLHEMVARGEIDFEAVTHTQLPSQIASESVRVAA